MKELLRNLHVQDLKVREFSELKTLSLRTFQFQMFLSMPKVENKEAGSICCYQIRNSCAQFMPLKSF